MRLIALLLSAALLALLFQWWLKNYYGNDGIGLDYESIDQQVNQVENQLDEYNQALDEYQQKTDSVVIPK